MCATVCARVCCCFFVSNKHLYSPFLSFLPLSLPPLLQYCSLLLFIFSSLFSTPSFSLDRVHSSVHFLFGVPTNFRFICAQNNKTWCCGCNCTRQTPCPYLLGFATCGSADFGCCLWLTCPVVYQYFCIQCWRTRLRNLFCKKCSFIPHTTLVCSSAILFLH